MIAYGNLLISDFEIAPRNPALRANSMSCGERFRVKSKIGMSAPDLAISRAAISTGVESRHAECHEFICADRFWRAVLSFREKVMKGALCVVLLIAFAAVAFAQAPALPPAVVERFQQAAEAMKKMTVHARVCVCAVSNPA